jgi:hypothetical protein
MWPDDELLIVRYHASTYLQSHDPVLDKCHVHIIVVLRVARDNRDIETALYQLA